MLRAFKFMKSQILLLRLLPKCLYRTEKVTQRALKLDPFDCFKPKRQSETNIMKLNSKANLIQTFSQFNGCLQAYFIE